MNARFRRRLSSASLAKGGSLLGVAVLATGLAARVVRTRLRATPHEVASPAPAADAPRRATRRTVNPKAGGGWTVSGGSRSREYRTQAEAEHAARSALQAAGGGELIVKGKDGKVRDQTTVGKADAHKGAEAHKSAEPRKSAEPQKTAEPHNGADAPNGADPHKATD